MSNYAIISVGGKQYRVAPGDVVRVDGHALAGDLFGRGDSRCEGAPRFPRQ